MRKNLSKSIRSLKNNQFIFSLLLIAVVLRLPAIREGLPAVYNSTEYFLAKIALNMGSRQSLDPLIYVYPTFYTYILLCLYGCYYMVGQWIGLFSDRTAFAVEFLIQPTNFYLLGRLLNVIISVLTIYLIYRILEKYRGKFFAGVAAAMATLSQFYIEFSGYATSDTLLIFFSTLTVLFFVIIDQSPRLSYLFVQGLWCSLAIASKYNAGVLVIGILINNFCLYQKYRLNYFKTTLISITGIIIGFFLTNPLWLIIPDKYYEGFHYRMAQMSIAVSTDHGLNYIWEINQLINKEWMIGFVFIAGTVFVLWKQNKHFLPQLTIVLLTFLYVGSWQKKGMDYLFAIFPIWIIFGTAWLEYVYHKFLKKEFNKIFFMGFVFFPSLLLSIYHGILFLGPDTREEATQWLIQHHRTDYKYCYDNYHYDLAVFDINRYVEYGAGSAYLPIAVKKELEKYRQDRRNIFLIPIMYQDPNPAYSGTNLYEKEESYYKRKDLGRLLAEGTNFLITNDATYLTNQRVHIEQYPPFITERIREIRDFNSRLDTHFKPIQVFKPGFWRKGPELKIYDLSKTVNSQTVK